jgi:stage V sporulation protein AD
MQSKILKFDGATIVSSASVVGKNEHDGPLGEYFDIFDPSDKFGMNTWEQAESEMQRLAFNTALSKLSLTERSIDAIFAGDLLNQCVGSSYGLLDFDIPYFGLYGACSTAAEGIMLASACVSAGYFSRAAAVTSSHYCSAERQYRSPIEYGAQRSPTAQWTVTGAGAFIISDNGKVKVTLGGFEILTLKLK